MSDHRRSQLAQKYAPSNGVVGNRISQPTHLQMAHGFAMAVRRSLGRAENDSPGTVDQKLLADLDAVIGQIDTLDKHAWRDWYARSAQPVTKTAFVDELA